MTLTIRPNFARPSPPAADLEREIRERYARGADRVELGLCCPTGGYDPDLLKRLPAEIVEKDYGCGDPSRQVHAGEVVVDSGSGAGKICYLLAQRVGASGRVIGLDFNDTMLALARKYQTEMADKLGYRNVEFHKARIQDLALDLDAAGRWLAEHPIATVEQASAFEAHCRWLRAHAPLIADDSVDVIVSNCVLNLVRSEEKAELFREMHRVLRRGGRCVISDIVSDEDPAPCILADPQLWSGCIAGAVREDRFLQKFAEAGFYGVEILSRVEEAWRVIDGVEFRAVTVRAYKGKEGECLERHQAVIYPGPWSEVRDDDGHIFRRGERMAVCDKTFQIVSDPAGPYAGQMIPVPPRQEVPWEQAQAFDCQAAATRPPLQTKGLENRETRPAGSEAGCDSDCGCC